MGVSEGEAGVETAFVKPGAVAVGDGDRRTVMLGDGSWSSPPPAQLASIKTRHPPNQARRMRLGEGANAGPLAIRSGVAGSTVSQSQTNGSKAGYHDHASPTETGR